MSAAPLDLHAVGLEALLCVEAAKRARQRCNRFRVLAFGRLTAMLTDQHDRETMVMMIVMSVLADDEGAGGIHLVHQFVLDQKIQRPVDAHRGDAWLAGLHRRQQVIGFHAAGALQQLGQYVQP